MKTSKPLKLLTKRSSAGRQQERMVQQLGGPTRTWSSGGEKRDHPAFQEHPARQERGPFGDRGDRHREVGSPLSHCGKRCGTAKYPKCKNSRRLPRERGEPRRDEMNERPLAARDHDLLRGSDSTHFRADPRFAFDDVSRPAEHAPPCVGKRKRSAAALVKRLAEGDPRRCEAPMDRRLRETERLPGAGQVAVGIGKSDKGTQRLKIHEGNYRRSR